MAGRRYSGMSEAQVIQTSWEFAPSLVPKSELPRWIVPYVSMIFSDESSQKKRFFVLGALYLYAEFNNRQAEIVSLENQLKELKADHGLFGRVKWEKVPSPGKYLEGYKALIRYVAGLRKKLYFKCMVVDTQKYPLNHKIICRGDELTGYLKMYCVFLTDGIMLVKEGAFYDITIDSYQFRVGHDHNNLKRSVNARYLNKCKVQRSRNHRHCDLVMCREQDSQLLQVVDLFVGAVAFCWNDGMLDPPSKKLISKKALVDVIQASYVGTKLDKPHHREPFRIWELLNARDGGLD